MRLIDADELLKDVIGIEDGWLKPPKGINSIADLIKKAPTISQGSIIKNCPWCGNIPIFRKISLDRGNGHGYPGNYEYYIECSSCGAIAPKGKCDDIYCSSDKAADAAIEAWNKRGH